MTQAERVADFLRWQISAESARLATERLDDLAESGVLSTPAERSELEGMQRRLDGESWSGLWLSHIASMLVRDAPEAWRDVLRQAVDRTAFAILDRPGVTVSVGTYADESHLFLFDRGAVFLLGALFGPLAAGWPVRGGHREPNVSGRVRRELRLELASRRFLLTSEGGLVRHLQDPERSSLAAYLTGRAVLFGMAHELGHVVLRHTVVERTLLLAGTELASVADDVELEDAADDFAAKVAFGDLSADHDPDLLFVHLCAARALLAVLASLESEVYAWPARTHPPAAQRWARIAEVLESNGHGSVLGRLDAFWISVGGDEAWAVPLPGPDVLLAQLRAAPDIDQDVLPDKVCGLLALADQHFANPSDEHANVLAAHPQGQSILERAQQAVDEHFTAHPSAGLSWQSLFVAVDPEYKVVPRPATISAVRLACERHRTPR